MQNFDFSFSGVHFKNSSQAILKEIFKTEIMSDEIAILIKKGAEMYFLNH